MKDGIRIGLTGEYRQIVAPEHLIGFMGDGVPGVLATAWLVWFMEHAARNAILPFMEEDEDSVGIELEIQHFEPTPVKLEVICRARVILVDGKKITYEIEAHDGVDKIGRAMHKRFVLDKTQFARRIQRKQIG